MTQTSGRADSPRGIETNGIGKQTTAHLNLTKSLRPLKARPSRRDRNMIRRFAGFDPTERQLGVVGGSWK